MPRDTWSPQLLGRYHGFADDPRFVEFAEQLEEEAMREGGSSPAGAFVYLKMNSEAIMKRGSIYDPAVLLHFKATDFIMEHLYYSAISAALDPDELRTQYNEFKSRALREGAGTIDGALQWISANMRRLGEENYGHSDWVLRNRALGFVQKYMSMKKNFGPQPPEDWAAMAAKREWTSPPAPAPTNAGPPVARQKPSGGAGAQGMSHLPAARDQHVQLRKGDYGNAAVRAVTLCTGAGALSPREAWDLATSEIFGARTPSQIKGCPRDAFLGLCEDGAVIGIPRGRYCRSVKNKRYAADAIALLQTEPSLTSDPKALWRRVMRGEKKVHNGQMDVVVGLWKAGLLARDQTTTRRAKGRAFESRRRRQRRPPQDGVGGWLIPLSLRACEP